MNETLQNSGTLAVVILTYNEELNLPHALESIAGWADEIFVFDSCSTDRTVEIARHFGARVWQHPFENYARQRNAALDQLPITSEWVLFLDADEWVPAELRHEIRQLIATQVEENGFYIKRRLIWMERWIRRGYYPTWILRLFRRGKARCEERQVNEHLVVEGKTGRLAHDFMHEDRKGLRDWIVKHAGYAEREAEELIRAATVQRQTEISARILGSQAERKRWLRHNVWNRLPPLVRPWLYFVWRLVLRGGILDGWQGVAYHFLHGLWFPMLIDIRYLELTRSEARKSPATGKAGY